MRSLSGRESLNGKDASLTEPQRIARSFDIWTCSLLQLIHKLLHRVTCKRGDVLPRNGTSSFPVCLREPSTGKLLDDARSLPAMSFKGLCELSLLGKRRESLTFADVVRQRPAQEVIHAFVGEAGEEALRKDAELLIRRELGECLTHIVGRGVEEPLVLSPITWVSVSAAAIWAISPKSVRRSQLGILASIASVIAPTISTRPGESETERPQYRRASAKFSARAQSGSFVRSQIVSMTPLSLAALLSPFSAALMVAVAIWAVPAPPSISPTTWDHFLVRGKSPSRMWPMINLSTDNRHYAGGDYPSGTARQ